MQQEWCQKNLESNLQGADIPVRLSITSTDRATLMRAEDGAAEGVEGSPQEGGGKTDWKKHQQQHHQQHFWKEK